jgi:shikimate kinase
MKHSIYFIGGASASGKSRVARSLAVQDGRSVVELDHYYDILEPAIHDHDVLVKTTGRIALEAVTQLLAADAFCIVEGGWIAPAQARKLKEWSAGRFYPVYCGYPKAKAEDRLAVIKKAQSHWLVEKSEKTARVFLETQIKQSHWYRKQCQKYDLPFFDFSSLEHGAASLSAHYYQWREMLTSSETSAAPSLS